jgi:membrane protease YdiL (CAAX protease family)
MPCVADTLKRRSLASFFALAYAISWGFWIPLVSYYLRVRPTQIPLSLLTVGAIGAYGPTFSALIMTWIEDGTQGVRALLSHLLDWRFGIRWYAYVLLVPAFIRSVSICLYALVLGDGLELDMGGLMMLLPYFLVALPYGPMAEEVGWRGYALPRLQAGRGALESGLILGVLWALWHGCGSELLSEGRRSFRTVFMDIQRHRGQPARNRPVPCLTQLHAGGVDPGVPR